VRGDGILSINVSSVTTVVKGGFIAAQLNLTDLRSVQFGVCEPSLIF